MTDPEQGSADHSAYPTAVYYDAANRLGLTIGLQGVAPVSAASQLCGPAYTVRFGPGPAAHPGVGLYEIIDGAPRGAVIIVEVGQPLWIAGENTTRFAELAGMAGFVTDGAIRDTEALSASSLPIHSAGRSVVGYKTLLNLQSWGDPIRCGGMTVQSGDTIVGDADGVVCLPANRRDEIEFEAGDIMELDRALSRAIEARLPLDELGRIRDQWGRRRPSTTTGT